MKSAALLALLFWQAAGGNDVPVTQPDHMQYQRAISVAAGAGQECAVLDAQIFPHAAPSLTDLRIFPSQAGSAGDGKMRRSVSDGAAWGKICASSTAHSCPAPAATLIAR